MELSREKHLNFCPLGTSAQNTETNQTDMIQSFNWGYSLKFFISKMTLSS